MELLTEKHIHYIVKDLSYRGLVDEDIQQEMVDHICCAVEKEMAAGKRFIDAYHTVLRSFGNTGGIQRLQHQVITTKTKAKGMLKSYLLIAMRNHLKNRFYTSINVSGLAVGIAACLIIMLYVVHELGYDRWNEKADRIYRVNTELRVGSVYHHLALGAASLPEHWSDYPEIASSVRILKRGWYPVRRESEAEPVYEKHVWADSTFFNIFRIPLLHGDARTALTEPNTVAISRKMAEKYFPEGDALNKSLLIGSEKFQGEDVCRVTAVFEDFPDNSHFHLDVIRSMVSSAAAKNVSLVGGGEMHVYLLFREDAQPEQLAAKFPAFIDEHIAPQLAAALQNDFSMEKFKAEGNLWRYSLTPLTDIHLHSDLEGEMEANGSIVYVYLFSSIALFILAIACINFMNLSTARSTDRAREVGIRKVMGSLRAHIIRQFLTESFLLSLAAFILALGIAHLFLPVFNELAQKNLTLPFGDYLFYLAMLGAAVVVGIMAGLYPSFFLSGFKPVSVLKGKVIAGGRSGMVRSGLVVFQFVISIFLIVATIVIERQLSFIQNKKIGFNKSQVLVVHQAFNLGNQLQSFKEEMLRNGFITDGTITGYLPVDGTWRNSNTWWPEGKAPTGADVNNMVNMQMWNVDYDYINTLGMTLKEGRNFSPQFPADSTEHFIINEAAVEAFGFGNDPIGKKISSFGSNPDGSPDLDNVRSWTVIGVVEDFHFESMRNNIAPVALALQPAPGYIAFRFAGGSTQQVLEAVEGQWNKMAAGKAFNYSFLDEDFGKMYASERRLGTMFAIFTGLAIIIACLGLFALTAFSVQQRTKEIGIRKTLGASIGSIVMLLSKSYGRLVLIAVIIAMPVSWYAVNRWLESYSYKASIGAVEYILAGALAFIIALLTISYQSIRAARANPANSLRSE